MGYDVTQDIEHTRFHIPTDKHGAALAAIRALPGAYEWVGERWRTKPTLASALIAWRWDVRIDSATGDIIGLEFEGENLGDEDTLFATLAPYVTEGGWIPCSGNGGEDHWAWWFHDGACWEVPGRVVYDREAADRLT